MEHKTARSVRRNATRAFNLTKQKFAKSLPIESQNTSDQYLNVFVQCKEQVKNLSTAFIRKVHIDPDPSCS